MQERILDKSIYHGIYLEYQEIFMQSAKLFINGRSQAVRLPKEYKFKGENVYIHKLGEAVILVPYDKEWEVFMHGINSFSADFMSEGRSQGSNQERENL